MPESLSSMLPATDATLREIIAALGSPLQAGAALPLPVGAARESGGNLDAIAAAQGAAATGIAQPTGGSGLQGWLSGLYKLANSAGIRLQNSDASPVSFDAPAQVYAANVSYSGTGLFSVAAAGFSTNQYLDVNPANSTGFDISQCQGVSVTFSGTYTGQSVIVEQSPDPSGAIDWLPVSGNGWANNGTAQPASGGATFSTSGQAYRFPVVGVRMRLRVTAIATGTIQAGIVLLGSCPDREAVVANLKPFTIGGLIPARLLATVSSGVIKTSNSQWYGGVIENTTASQRYLQLYQKTTAGVPGTDTPFLTVPLSANSTRDLSFTTGISFTPGLSWATTTDFAGVNPATTAGDVVGTVLYF